MNILLITQAASLKRTWGITKVVIDASEAMEQAGVNCDLFPPHSIDPDSYEATLRAYLETTRGKYDVIEIPDTLRYDLNPRDYAPLVVTRSVLLPLHRKFISFPQKPTTFPSKIRHLLFKNSLARKEAQQLEAELKVVNKRLKEGHLINVANSKDREVLIKEGYAAETISVLPYGLNDSRFETLNALQGPGSDPRRKGLVFVGTFDFRKGCLDIVRIFQEFRNQHPHATLKLLGTKGLMTSKKQVLSFFPKQLRTQIEVVESFSETELPDLLKDCDVGLFPSYWEGFGISVVELLAAGIPVVAYKVPGPCDILPQKWLVEPGDTHAMTQTLLSLAESDHATQAKQAAARFRWTDIGKATVLAYEEALSKKANP